MGVLAAASVLPSNFKPSLSLSHHRGSLFHYTRTPKKRNRAIFPVNARLFGPAIFEASKLKVLFLGVDEKKHPGKLPRTYTLTHSDVTSKLTLAISQTIDDAQLQGWYNKLQRDEVVARWKKVKNKMSLHVHCHISGSHFLLDLFARLRYFIFCKELPVVLKAFVHGDCNLFNSYPELQEALVWVHFHSSVPEFNKVECWGTLIDAAAAAAPSSESSGGAHHQEIKGKGEEATSPSNLDLPEPCQEDCDCCFPPATSIAWCKSN
ncbi:protein STAY-GREEN homolog, chloroplastic-like [Malus sylvestris]|uniref:protein STAY-GREEN homolog, chloroplastic-like n=1 Tax=Malus sylvestris TaxID=3752 RepID=UPI0021ABD20F|nr:protein STAY-GREEN homolog, chloroplastic-like [Malus sylvestris]